MVELQSGKARIGFFSFTEVTDPSAHRAYNEWHQLDHMPEQYPLPGLLWGQRWVASPACRAMWLEARAPLDRVHYMTLYLMGEPLQETLTRFAALGAKLHESNRFFGPRKSHLSGPFPVRGALAARRVLVSAAAVPFRPNLGVYVLAEELPGDGAPVPPVVGLDALNEIRGVAGVWIFESEGDGTRWKPGRRRVTLCYLDEPVIEVAATVGSALRSSFESSGTTPILAGPFETILPWHWDWFDASR
ncbi:MAG: hypothetical protein ACYDD4_12000 [Acidimicrobiales bacterium]